LLDKAKVTQHNDTMQKALNTAIVLLIIVALILGYFIIKPKNTNPPPVQHQQAAQNSTPIPVQKSPEQLGYSQKYLSSLSADEQHIIALPLSSPSLISDNAKIFKRAAKTAPYLDITGCESTPVVFQVKRGQKITIKNNDSTPHTIIIGKDQVEVLANSAKDIVPQLPPTVEFFPYPCDNNSSIKTGLRLIYFTD
jgi:hypothetical protein